MACAGMSAEPSGSARSSFSILGAVVMLKVFRSVVSALIFCTVLQHGTYHKRLCKQHGRCVMSRALVSDTCRAINWIRIQGESLEK